jgi:hypothetical protein
LDLPQRQDTSDERRMSGCKRNSTTSTGSNHGPGASSLPSSSATPLSWSAPPAARSPRSPASSGSTSTLGNWVRQDAIDRGEREGLSSDERARLGELERENARLRMERDLGKRTVAFWVKETSTP